ncbi:hypothetical protein JZM24_04900 [Candidatus Sodalis endolongispinus]|uniref:Uncharacterized protein n=2 Tax=Candidatus Sodalis endolongispinus TaxID=2812662 RepID=A0ABS5Y9J9_9GAMM|nr:hypothetical protein [Candidatus Sodalis endolongispinus]
MKNCHDKKVHIEISHNQEGEFSLLVSDDDIGTRIAGEKVGGCRTLKRFTVNAQELIDSIKEHAHE